MQAMKSPGACGEQKSMLGSHFGTHAASLQDTLEKAGQLAALGPLEENAPDEDEEFEGAEGEGEEEGGEEAVADDGADDLAAAMAQKVHIR